MLNLSQLRTELEEKRQTTHVFGPGEGKMAQKPTEFFSLFIETEKEVVNKTVEMTEFILQGDLESAQNLQQEITNLVNSNMEAIRLMESSMSPSELEEARFLVMEHIKGKMGLAI